MDDVENAPGMKIEIAALEQEKQKHAQALGTKRSSAISGLYDGLIKNVKSILKLGNATFPVIRTQLDSTGQVRRFSASPNFSRAFNNYLPYIASIVKNYNSDDNGCMGIDRRTLRSMKNPATGQFEEPTSFNIEGCDNEKCNRCHTCHVLKSELARAYNGMTDDDAGDSLRSMFIKHFLTTGHHLVKHLVSRGGDIASQEDHAYDDCAASHLQLARVLHKAFSSMTSGYNKDYMINLPPEEPVGGIEPYKVVDSNLTFRGGGIHSDTGVEV